MERVDCSGVHMHAACLLMSCVDVEARGCAQVLQRRAVAAGGCGATAIRGDTIYTLPAPAADDQAGLHSARALVEHDSGAGSTGHRGMTVRLQLVPASA